MKCDELPVESLLRKIRRKGSWKANDETNGINVRDIFVSSHIFLFFLTKLGFSRNIFIKFPNIKFHRDPSSENLTDTCVQMNRRADGRMEE